MMKEEAAVETTPVKVVIGIGSNCQQKAAEMEAACRWLCGVLGDCRVSKPYHNPATACSLTPMPYLNAVAVGLTSRSASQLQALCKTYEQQRGRTPQTDRTRGIIIDLDVVVYNTAILRPSQSRQPYFTIPLSTL